MSQAAIGDLDSGLLGSLFLLLRYLGTLRSVINEQVHCSEHFFLFHLPVSPSEGEKVCSALPMLLSDLDLLRMQLTLPCPEWLFFFLVVIWAKFKTLQKE